MRYAKLTRADVTGSKIWVNPSAIIMVVGVENLDDEPAMSLLLTVGSGFEITVMGDPGSVSAALERSLTQLPRDSDGRK